MLFFRMARMLIRRLRVRMFCADMPGTAMADTAAHALQKALLLV